MNHTEAIQEDEFTGHLERHFRREQVEAYLVSLFLWSLVSV